MNNICDAKSEVSRIGEILIPYSHSLLSLFISMTIIQIYDEKGF